MSIIIIKYNFSYRVQSPSYRLFSTSRHQTFMRKPERYARRKNLPGNYRRVEKSGKKRKKEREKERGEERKRRRSRPKSERRENLARRSVDGRKEVPVRGPPTSTSVYLWYLSLSFDYSWGVVPPSAFSFSLFASRGEGYRVLGTRLYRYRTPPHQDGGALGRSGGEIS